MPTIVLTGTELGIVEHALRRAYLFDGWDALVATAGPTVAGDVADLIVRLGADDPRPVTGWVSLDESEPLTDEDAARLAVLHSNSLAVHGGCLTVSGRNDDGQVVGSATVVQIRGGWVGIITHPNDPDVPLVLAELIEPAPPADEVPAHFAPGRRHPDEAVRW